MRKFLPVVFVALLSACAMSADGPKASAVKNGRLPHTHEKIPVVELADAPMGPHVTAYAPADKGLVTLRSVTRADTRLKRGDTIEVTIFDTGEEAVFSSTDSKTLNLGRFTVDQSGYVIMPFVGRQHVLDSTADALSTQIVNGLKGQAVNPQAVVTVVDKPSNGINVSGGVKAPGLFPLTAKRERVLDALALAGGASVETANVTVIRDKSRATAPLSRILRESAQNIVLSAGDQIIVDGDNPSFTAFGAFKNVGEFEFEPGKLTLAQALARAGGLLDSRANPRDFYVLRNEKVANSAAAASAGKSPDAPFITVKPIIYRVNLRDVSNFLLMQQFHIQDGDILYASNAGLVDAAKIVTVFQKGAETAAAPPPGAGN
ncbi:polysaccharide biosynthesis/export family protein [Limoniibacter endophyticus]|uniref:Capsule polysaccharide transporter n=1 Tax=Limoniibacter endophyticus TaxID=1565040 RepID=A0A8J3DGN6_9HYPH|nr:polysaccharide biosynthesis/export family protein [Limoniibacter endophyticus]GHC69563.1 capsule polysaccharide transporter [Limoniibacter endophyticus]